MKQNPLTDNEKKLKPMGSYLGVDENGYLVSEVSKEKIQPALQPLLDEVIEIAKESLGSLLHSVYVRGSVAKGAFVPHISDLDMEFVVYSLPDENLKNKFRKDIDTLAAQHPETTKIEKILWTVESFTEEADIITKYQSVCLYGDDLTKGLSPMKPGTESAEKMSRILQELEKAIPRIESGEDTLPLKQRSVWLCKRMIRRAHELVEGRLQRFTRDIYPCYEGASQIYPEHEALFREVAEVAVFGTEDKEYLLDLARQMQEFLSVEIPKVMKTGDA